MAEATQQVVIEYIAKVDKLQSDVDKLNQSTEDLNKGAKKAGETITEEVGKKPLKAVETLKEKFNKLGNVIAAAFAVKKVGDFITSCLQAATAAQEIKIVFDKLNDPALLSKLRSAVSGTVSDFNLMKIAVKANNFKIPLQDLAKLFEFAKIKADETGQSVESLADTIVQSVGRNSTRALVELGISQESINQKVKETGSLYKGITAIIDSELAKQGEDIDSVADKQDRLNASIENSKEAIGKTFLPFVAEFLDGLNITLSQLQEFFDKNHISQKEFQEKEIADGRKSIALYKEYGDLIKQVEQERFDLFKKNLGEGKKSNEELYAAQKQANDQLTIDIARSSARQENYSQAVALALTKTKGYIDEYVAANKQIPITEEEKKKAAEAAAAAQDAANEKLQEAAKLFEDNKKAVSAWAAEMLKLNQSFTSIPLFSEGLTNAERDIRAATQAWIDQNEAIRGVSRTEGHRHNQEAKNLQDEVVLVEDKTDIWLGYADTVGSIFGVINGYTSTSAQHQIDVLQKANEAGTLSDAKYAEERKKILQKQAREDRAFAIFQAGIQVPQAILSAIPEGPAAVVLASILAFAQLAAIIAEPLPAFKKGVIDFRGRGTGESDDNVVRISNRESIITAKGTIKHKAALEAINKDTFDDYILRLYLPKLVKSSTGANSLTFDDSEIVKAQYRAIQESNQNSKRLLKVLSSNQNIRRN